MKGAASVRAVSLEGPAVTLPSFAVEELRRLKREQAENLLALWVRRSGETLIWARCDGEPLQPQSLTHEFPRFLARLKDFPLPGRACTVGYR